MKRKLSKTIQNNKGSLSIEIAIGTMLFIVCFSVIIDFMITTWKSDVATQVTTRVAREVGLQGGFLAAAPQGFPGGDRAYSSNTEIQQMVHSHFRSAGIKDNDWKITIYSKNNPSQKTVFDANASPATPEFDYREPIIVETIVQYKWEFSNKLLPLSDRPGILYSSRPTISEWKYNYGVWENE